MLNPPKQHHTSSSPRQQPTLTFDLSELEKDNESKRESKQDTGGTGTQDDDSESASTSSSSADSYLSRQSAPAIMMTVTHQQHPHPKSSAKGASLLWPPTDRDLMAAVRTALHWTPRKRTKPIFDFALSTAAANRNFATLQKADFDLQMLLMSDGYSPLQPGSEFRPVSLLAPVLEGHPLWPRLRNTLLRGAEMELKPIPEQDRLTHLDKAIAYGNHKSATTHSDFLVPILQKEVAKGWHLPLPIDRLHEIPGLVVGPMGAVAQQSIDENGNPLPKIRMTHDQSFTYELETIESVNQRVIPSSLPKCVYGFTLRRLAHAIVALRGLFPLIAILIGKLDYKSAYRRMHLHALSALQSVITTQGLTDDPVALASLRVTFGGRPSPFLFSDLSEQVADLANVLTRCKLWDPAELLPKLSSLIGQPKLADKSIPFAPARQMIVNPGTDSHGLTDVFLDDLVSVFPALSKKHIDRCSMAALLALESQADHSSMPNPSNGKQCLPSKKQWQRVPHPRHR